ncbi:hypothetical protein [Romboutsia sp.]|uniref:hypothetical protein n=1 Tax=Romboutsia sp. TaxID=1965302 RepID=UPI002C5152D7|nr:hypothetical protein [Romboutsia sp.]HSQ89500.1 hypothetical protein [Romboutsia sp.]
MSPSEIVPGGWVIDIKHPCCVCKKLICCFDKAFEDLLGANYEIVLYLGYQVVAGTNHMLLCKQTLTTNPPEEHLVIVKIFKSLNCECSVTSVETII